MKNEENLNTEPNSIAGNPVGGPAGNTAARPLPVSTSATPQGGSPTQLPTAASMGKVGATPVAGTSNADLSAAATSAGKGGIDAGGKQENKAVDPTSLNAPAKRGRKPGSTNKAKETPQAAAKPRGSARKETPAASRQPENYGGNFGNDMHDSYQDQARYDNQASDASRGEFGAFGGHATHGGYGNQNREADYQRHGSAEDRYYGGPGRYGPQHNAYREYDGRDERWDERRNYGYERGFHPDQGYDDRRGSYDRPRGSFATGYDGYGNQGREYSSGNYNDGRGNRYDNRNQPDRGDYYSGRQNDNGSRQGRGGGYADDYGRSSLRGANPYGYDRPRYDEYRDDRRGYAPDYSRRNQDEDYRSSRGGYDNQGSAGGRGGHREDDYGHWNRQGGAGNTGQRNAYGEGYGYGFNRNEQPRRPNYGTGDERNGYGRSYGGDSGQGMGSRGGSYNDAYDDSRRDSRNGSPARGDYRREDADRNYGQGQRPQYRPDDEPDYGTAPRRNRGRDGEGDE